MKKWLLLASYYLLTLFFVACNNDQSTYIGESELAQNSLGILKTDTINNEYSLEMPKIWAIKNMSNEAVKLLNASAVNNVGNEYIENMYIEKVRKGLPIVTDTIFFKKDSLKINKHVDLNQFGKQYVNGFLTAYNEVKVLEVGEALINNTVAKQYVFVYKDVAASQEELKTLVYLIPFGTADVYVVQCTESASNFIRVRSIFENAISSLRFL